MSSSDSERKPRVTLSNRSWNVARRNYENDGESSDDSGDKKEFTEKAAAPKASERTSNATNDKSSSESESEDEPAPAPTPQLRSVYTEENVNVNAEASSDEEDEYEAEALPNSTEAQNESDDESESSQEDPVPTRTSNYETQLNIPVTSLSDDDSENCSDEANDLKPTSFQAIEELSTSEDEEQELPAAKIVLPTSQPVPNLQKSLATETTSNAPLTKIGDAPLKKISNFANSALKKVAEAEGFKNYKFQFEEESVGEGFSGILVKVIITEGDNSRELNVVVKSPPENKVQRDTVGTMKLFEREVSVYRDLFPQFLKFQKEFYLTQGFYEFPKCYLAEFDEEHDDAVIILEDLRDSGYQKLDKNVPINYEHAKLAFATLGRLHGVSIAMKDRWPLIFKRFQDFEDNTKGNLENKMIFGFMEGCMDKAIATLRPDEVKRRDKMLDYKANLADLMRELTNSEGAEPFAVMSHGDCWSNNFMFKYRSGRPDKIRLLDFQASRYSSPACDLTYLLFACTDQELRKKYYDEFLTIYYQSVKDVLERVRCDVMKVFPFTALVRQLKKYGKYGVFISCFILPMLSMKTEDLPDTKKQLEGSDKEHLVNSMQKGIQSDAIAIRMRGNLEDAFKYGYL